MQNLVHERIQKDIENNDVVLFMKGTATMPQCGFSALTVQVLSQLGVVFKDINVLEDRELWQGIKDYNDWPTIPQLFVKGEFIGGASIVRDMYQEGELQTVLADKGVLPSDAA